MSRARRPKKEHFIEGFDKLEKFADYYGVQETSARGLYSLGRMLYIYYKQKAKNMMGYSRKKIFVRTDEILYYLQTEGYIGVDEFDWSYANSSIKRKGDRVTQMCALSSKVKGKIRDELIDNIYDIVKQYGTSSDRYRIKRVLDEMKEYGEKTKDIGKRKKAREIIEGYQGHKPQHDKRAQRGEIG